MSGCVCESTSCLTGHCRCLREKSFCSEDCSRNDCQNTEDNKDAVDSRYKAYWKKKTGAITRPQKHRCTSKCKCQGCTNGEGLGGGVTNNEEGQESEDIGNNVPGKVVPTTRSREIRCLDQEQYHRARGTSMAHTITRGGKKKANAVMKLAGMAVFAMLFTAASAGRTTPLSPVRESIKNHEMASGSGSILGCKPKVLARDIILFCREPHNAPFRVEACCGAAVGTVARPSCFCLVRREPAFGMSPLFNMTNLKHMLAKCGASLHLTQTLHNPCDGSYTETQTSECRSSHPSSHIRLKILSYIELGVIAMLMAAIGFLILRRPVAETEVAFAPRIRPVSLAVEDDKEVLSDDRARIEDDGPHGEMFETSDDATKKETLLDVMAVPNDDHPGNEDGGLHGDFFDISNDATSEEALLFMDGNSDDTSSSVFRMSGCVCESTSCLTGYCGCFKAKLPCSANCKCKGCKNTKENKDEVDWRYTRYLKNKEPIVRKVNGCNCKTGCATSRCSCYLNAVGCTSKCKCQECANPKGRRESKTNTKPAHESKDKVSNVPVKAAQTTPSRVNRSSGSNK